VGHDGIESDAGEMTRTPVIQSQKDVAEDQVRAAWIS
jgi:hypothetical protein